MNDDRAFDETYKVAEEGPTSMEQRVVDLLIEFGELAPGMQAGGGMSMGHIEAEARVRTPTGQVEQIKPQNRHQRRVVQKAERK